LTAILANTTTSNEQKLLAIEYSFFKKHKNASQEEKEEFVKELNKIYQSAPETSKLYLPDGSNEITKEITALSDNDAKLYFISNLIVNPNDYNIRIKQLIENVNFTKSPFFTQELSVKITYAYVVNPELFTITQEDGKAIDTRNIVYILGNGGTGKTAVIFKMVIELLKNNNPNLHL
jgi:Cdc6-like AAA superfamily ATPase